MSLNSNPFFDTSVLTEDGLKTVRVMVNPSTSRTLFQGKCDIKSPVRLSNIGQSQANNKNESIYFYNSNTGSRMQDQPDISFKYELPTPTNIDDLKYVEIGSLVNVSGKIKCTESPRSVLCTSKEGQRYEKLIRHALLADDEGSSIMVSLWGDLIL